MAHDFLGNELSIGDDVVFLNYNGTSASLERGKITRVSEHTAEISGKRRAEYKIIKVNPVKPAMDNTWIPCSERLPERGESVLFWPAHGDGRCRSGFYDYTSRSGATWFTTWDYCTDYVASHWIPTPEPPEDEQK